MTTAYPLVWPQGMPRITARVQSRFKTSLQGAIANVLGELRRFGADTGKQVDSVVVSSNVTLTDARPADPGIAVYFRWDNIDCCIAVDRYRKVEENVQAISIIIDAERTKMRHGGLNVVRAAMRGYAALPPPKDPSGQLAAPWWQVLEVPKGAPLHAAEASYRKLIKQHHPDQGGDAATFNRITEAMRQAREELGGK